MFPTALEMKELTRTPASTDTILRLATLSALYEAASGNLTAQGSVTTDAISTGSADEQTMQKVFNELNQAGFTLTLSDTSFTATWQR